MSHQSDLQAMHELTQFLDQKIHSIDQDKLVIRGSYQGQSGGQCVWVLRAGPVPRAYWLRNIHSPAKEPQRGSAHLFEGDELLMNLASIEKIILQMKSMLKSNQQWCATKKPGRDTTKLQSWTKLIRLQAEMERQLKRHTFKIESKRLNIDQMTGLISRSKRLKSAVAQLQSNLD